MEKLSQQINIKSRTPISEEVLREKFTVICEFEDVYRHWYLVNQEPNIWAVRRETPFDEVWEVHRNLITLIVNHVEEIEWIVKTLKWSWQKRFSTQNPPNTRAICPKKDKPLREKYGFFPQITI